MTPTVLQVYDTVRQVLGDLYVATGEIFTNDILAGPFGLAFRELYSEMNSNGVKDVLHVAYTTLPTYTSMLDPAAHGLPNFGELSLLRQRANIVDRVISSVTPTGPAGSTLQVTTSAPHSLPAGQEIQVFGVVGIDGTDIGANGRWYYDIISPTIITLRGSIWTGIAFDPASAGTVVSGYDLWTEMIYTRELPSVTPDATLELYRLIGKRIYFVGSTVEHELEISYYGTGDAPLTGTVGVDDSLNFLAYRTGYWACLGRPAFANHIPMLEKASDMYLAQIIQTMVVYGMPSVRPRPFRRYRKNRFYTW